MSTDVNAVVTPEAVALDLDLAELGSRLGAYAIDFLVQVGIWIVLAVLTGIGSAFGVLGSSATTQAIVAALGFIVVFWGYFPFLEEIWNGKTIGKRALGLRVVRVSGQPSGFAPILLRNLLRPVDMVLLGPIFMVLTRRHQRIGDLAAGTVVIREAKKEQPSPVVLAYGPSPDLPLDTSGLTDPEYGLIRSFLERRFTLNPAARAALSAQLANMARGKVPGSMAYGWGDEVLLEAVLGTVRQRYQQAPAYAGTWAPPPVTLPVDLVAPSMGDGFPMEPDGMGAELVLEPAPQPVAEALEPEPLVEAVESEPVVEAVEAEPEPVAAAQEPEAEEPVVEAVEAEPEPVAAAQEPEAEEEPVVEAVEQPVADAQEPEAEEEPGVVAPEPVVPEPVVEAVAPDAVEPEPVEPIAQPVEEAAEPAAQVEHLEAPAADKETGPGSVMGENLAL